MVGLSDRRNALKGFGIAAGLAALSAGGASAAPTASTSLLPKGATRLQELTDRLAQAPRRRDFKTVPMILTTPDQWDHEALSEVIAYQPFPKQVWDNTDIGGPWLNLMRNSMNAQIWSFKHAEFLAVSNTHGSRNWRSTIKKCGTNTNLPSLPATSSRPIR